MDHTVNIVDVFGSCDTAKAGADAYMLSNNLHVNFPDDVLYEASKLDIDEPDPDEVLRRLDLRGEPIFTIDGADTKDIDDAVSIAKTDRCYKLGVHIADVSHYVTKGSKLDEEAFYRGTSIYYADQVVPMLPRQLSNGICSLNPQVDRLAFSCLMDVGFDGKLLSYRFEKSVIRSRVKGVYSEVNKIIDGTAVDEIKTKYARVIDRIPIMKELADILVKNRVDRGAPEIDTSETKIITDENGVCIDVKPRTTGIAEGIIEEFMLMANKSAAALAMKEKIPFVYRVHEAPTTEKLDQLRETLTALGINPGALGANAPASELARILRENKDSDRAMVINRIVLRTMMKARYSEEPLGHYGLVMPEYAHFTSPIRRYADPSDTPHTDRRRVLSRPREAVQEVRCVLCFCGAPGEQHGAFSGTLRARARELLHGGDAHEEPRQRGVRRSDFRRQRGRRVRLYCLTPSRVWCRLRPCPWATTRYSTALSSPERSTAAYILLATRFA